jgi:uncharacterized repeat protein (TIGR02059 family)
MRRNVLLLVIILISVPLSGATFYVSPSGKDSNNGDISHPFATLNKVWTIISPGDQVYLRGGTYSFDNQQYLTGKNGTSDNLIRIWAYPGEIPILTKSGNYRTNSGIYFSGNYFYFKGLDISGYTQIDGGVCSGFSIENSSHNIFELLNYHNNGSGMAIWLNSTDNLILNCDFHHNQDPLTPGSDKYGNADGLALNKVAKGTINTIWGCRFWWNTDDGIDPYGSDGSLIIENCWSFFNGYIPDTYENGGDGSGYKLGMTATDHGNEILFQIRNCLAYKNKFVGFDQNGASAAAELYNNTSCLNGSNGYYFNDYNRAHIFKNNLSFNDVNPIRASNASILSNNTFGNSGLSVSESDFISLDGSQLMGNRKADGSLPDIDFLHLSPGSDLIDAGVDVGLPYTGKAPDIGAFELQTGSATPVPTYVYSVIENSTPSLLEIGYNLNLDNQVVPATSSFGVSVNSVTRTINSVYISGNTVQLTLASAVKFGDLVTVSYTKPVNNPLQTYTGGEAVGFSAFTVTNNCISNIPVYSSSVVENATPSIIEMTYSLSLANIVPASSAFNVQVNSVGRTVNSVSISGNKVQLTIASAVKFGDIITISYTKPANSPLQTPGGVVAASISSKSVTNNCEDVNKANVPPIVVAIYSQIAYSGFVYKIDATGSYDFNNDILNYSWIVSNNVSVSSTASSSLEYLAPVVTKSQILEFQVKVSDGTDIVSKSISINIMPYKPTLTKAKITKVDASNFEQSDSPNNIIDGNTATKWSSKGDNQWLLLKLGEPYKISYLELAFLPGQRYESYFDVFASKDNLTWESIMTNKSSCDFSGDRQVFDFPVLNTNTEYSFVKYVGHGNSLNTWNNISEFSIFGSSSKNPGSASTEKVKLIIYPNPAKDFFYVSIDEPGLQPIKIRIIDFSGKIVCEYSISGPGSKNLQLPDNLYSGIYVVEAITGSAKLGAQKLIIKR